MNVRSNYQSMVKKTNQDLYSVQPDNFNFLDLSYWWGWYWYLCKRIDKINTNTPESMIDRLLKVNHALDRSMAMMGFMDAQGKYEEVAISLP